MFKRNLKVFLGIIFLIGVYLFLAHWSIYHRLTLANLKASDNRHSYIFNEQMLPSRGLVYEALGDSLTSGVGVSKYEDSFPYLVAQKMAGKSTKVTHLNFSYPGAKTADLIRDLLAKAIDDKPNLVTLLIGTNDVHGGVSDTEFRKNYETLLSQLQTQTTAKINVISIPFIGTDSLVLPPWNLYYRNKTLRFNLIIKELATSYHATYIDLTSSTAQFSSKGSDYYSADNFHPSSVGYAYWSQIIYEHLDK